MLNNCIFCAIAAGEISSAKVYEDDTVFAFRDINPQAPVHILVIPKTHISGVSAITAENSFLTARCFEAIAKIAQQEKLDNGFRVISNCGEDAGQTVMHLHFHILAGKAMSDKML